MLKGKFSGVILEFSSKARIFVRMILIVIGMCVGMKVEQNLFRSKQAIFKSWTQLQCDLHIAIFTVSRFRFSQLGGLEGKHDFEGNRDFQTLNLGFPGHFD